MTNPLLEMKDVRISFTSSTGVVEAVRGVNMSIYPGQSVAIVGESGSGKSTTAMSILGLLPGTGKVTGGQVLFEGEDITHYNNKQFEALRGNKIGLVPQDPMSNLNPVWRIGTQVEESLKANNVVEGSERHKRVVELLEEAGLPDAERRAKQYPHEFSGGMRQRALIAMGLAAHPKLLIADEPTSALDVTVAKKILDHLAKLTNELGTSVVLITHDLGLAAERADRLVVMQAGHVVETGPALEVLTHPQHPYTKQLIAAAPSLAARRGDRVVAAPTTADHEQKEILVAKNLVRDFAIPGDRPWRKDSFRAVDDISFTLRRGRTIGIVGESGSGKSTVANMALGLLDPTEGEVLFDGKRVQGRDRKEELELRRRIQPIFQNPYATLDPMRTVHSSIEEPLRIHKIGTKKEREQRVFELLDRVALPAEMGRRFPGELSGGQRQRVLIAMALTRDPSLVLADEPTTALDVTVQKQVIDLLNELREKLGFAMVFVSHDLALVAKLAHRITVMYAGQVVEQAPTSELLANPVHEYTRGLLGAVLSIESGSKRLHQVRGVVPSPSEFVKGDRFAPRSAHPTVGLETRPVLKPVPGTTEHSYAITPELEALLAKEKH